MKTRVFTSIALLEADVESCVWEGLERARREEAVMSGPIALVLT